MKKKSDNYQEFPPLPPQLLLTTCGALLQKGAVPLVLVGQAIQLPHSVRSKLEQLLLAQPLQVIQRDPGAILQFRY